MLTYHFFHIVNYSPNSDGLDQSVYEIHINDCFLVLLFFYFNLQMQVGDIILEINGESVHGKTTKEGLYQIQIITISSTLSSFFLYRNSKA